MQQSSKRLAKSAGRLFCFQEPTFEPENGCLFMKIKISEAFSCMWKKLWNTSWKQPKIVQFQSLPIHIAFW